MEKDKIKTVEYKEHTETKWLKIELDGETHVSMDKIWNSLQISIFRPTFDDLLKIKAAVDKALMEEADRLETSAIS